MGEIRRLSATFEWDELATRLLSVRTNAQTDEEFERLKKAMKRINQSEDEKTSPLATIIPWIKKKTASMLA